VRVELSDLPQDWERCFEKRTISSGSAAASRHQLHDGARAPHQGRGSSDSLDDIRRLLTAFRNLVALPGDPACTSAALSTGGHLLFSEDIGSITRWTNWIGKAVLKGVPVENKVLLTSGRVTSEIMTKREEPVPHPYQPCGARPAWPSPTQRTWDHACGVRTRGRL